YSSSMGRCVQCHFSTHCKRHRSFRLQHRNSLSRSLWLNEHVLHHYRPPKMPASLCIQSIFHWTNETINIWSHLLGFIYFTYCQFERQFISLPLIGASSTEHIVVSLSLFGSQMCMFLSATFHIFGCQSARSRQQYLQMDLFGISAGILSMYITGIYTSFFCFETHLRSYLAVLLCLFLITGIVPFRKDSLDAKVIGSRIGWVHIIYSLVILFGLCPSIHWIFLHGGFEHPHVVEWFPSVLIVYSLTGAAFFFYVSMFPERIRPGKFDLVGCSHQWWHLLILAAMVSWQSSSIQLLTYYHSNDQICQSFAPTPPFHSNHSNHSYHT
ncbi:hypothetical protein PMAYCL1PPCAC_18075, partial [Pristionchus mayeri]